MSRTVSDLRVGEHARIAGYADTTSYSERLMQLGLIPGTQITLQRIAPLGDPVEIRFRGYSLVLRPSEARGLLLENP